MHYFSNHYASNHYSSNHYNNNQGVVTPVVGDNYYDKLGNLGYFGTLGDRQMMYLADLGYSCANSQRKFNRLRDLGYTGGTVSEMLKQKTDAEGFCTVSEMMTKTGLIPV